MKEGGGLLYLDSSALVKLVLPEPETEALFQYLRDWPELISSEIARIEVLRAARRVSPNRLLAQRAEQVLESIHLLSFDSRILGVASQLDPPALRTLDAIHLTSALELGQDLAGFVAYDEALLAAANRHGLRTESPAA